MTYLRILAAAALFPLAATAQFLDPAKIDDALVGDWQCGETRIFITELGSIEILNAGYRAGLYRASDGNLEILWDEGGEITWSYSANNDGITLSTPDEEEYSCAPRE